jgi:ABC-type Fe3+/spermidine/putrescine transport system ATPase subunit
MAGELSIQRVTKNFESVLALKNIDLTVKSAEFVSFLGPSGCGKTTMLRIIAGFEFPTSGDVTIDGRSITKLQPYERPVGMVFQNLALFPHLNVADNVGFGLAVRRLPKREAARKIDDALQLVGLADFQTRRVHQLSGGQKQRVALARALVTEPALLLLDEPLSALDLKLRRQLQAELKGIQHRTATTFIFVTHDQEEAMAMSDRVAVFRDGMIEQVGPPREIYRNPATRFVAEFVGETNILDAVVSGGMVELGSMKLRVRKPAAIQTDGAVTLSLRPEYMRLSNGPGEEAVKVRVKEVEFGGMSVRCVACVEATGALIRATTPADVAQNLAAGSEIWLKPDLDASTVVARGAG